MYGYMGNLLYINLSRQQTRALPLRAEYIMKYIGGLGLAIKFLHDHVEPNVDPLSPENTLILTTGPICGVLAPTGCSYVFATKSPLTSGIGLSVYLGLLGVNMKRAGYDAVLIKGKSEKPVWLWIYDDYVEFKNADDIWGESSLRAQEIIKKELNDDSISIATIGIAGEKLSRIASIIEDEAGTIGRMGLGAVMGSKNLKAIAVKGTKDLKVAYVNELLQFCRESFLKMRGVDAVKYYVKDKDEWVSLTDRFWSCIHGNISRYRDSGGLADIALYNKLKCLPTKNFSECMFEGIEQIDARYMNEHFEYRTYACPLCPIDCVHLYRILKGPYKDSFARIDYGSACAFGPNCGVNNMETIIRAVELCVLYGLDPISTGNVIGFAMDCYEKGILTYLDTGGLDLRFGNHEAMLEMVDKIGSREGLGDLLAEGVKYAAFKLGDKAVYLANHIKGLEMPNYDLKHLKTAALAFAVSFTGADERTMAHLLDIKGIAEFMDEKEIAQSVKNMEDFYAVIDSLIVCRFTGSIYDGFNGLARLYYIVTGVKVAEKELQIVGERINNLARLFNTREGFTCMDDKIPSKIMCLPVNKAPMKETVTDDEEFSMLLQNYYRVRGWASTGVPLQEKVRELEI